MKELMGLAVLAAPLLAVVVVIVIAIVATVIAMRMQTTWRRRWLAGAIALSLVILIPTWDEIAGRIYFSYLCRTDAGIRVYKRVDPGPEFRDVEIPYNPAIYQKMPIAVRFPYGLESVED